MVVTVSYYNQENPWAFTLFEYLHAYDQYKNKINDYSNLLDIKFTNDISQPGIHVIIISHPLEEIPDDLTMYDIILLDTADEPLVNFNDIMLDVLNTYPNSWIVSNSTTTNTHALHDRIIPTYGDWDTCLNWWLRPIYPQKFLMTQTPAEFKKNIVFINGSNRTWRDYFLRSMRKCGIDTVNNITQESTVVTTPFCSSTSSDEDIKFFNYLNEQYPFLAIKYHVDRYYNNLIPMKIDAANGYAQPGYFLLDEYLNYHCVVFPETDFKNNELPLTEKALKCFMVGVLPFPIGGANINSLYNSMGFRTVIELLPNDLEFDHILDHQERFKIATEAIEWLNQHTEVFSSTQAKEIIQSNKEQFFAARPVEKSIERLYNIIMDMHK